MNRPALSAALLVLLVLAVGPSVLAAQPEPLLQGTRAYQERRYEEARRFFAAYVLQHPRDAAAAYWHGRTLLGLGTLDEATRELVRATELAPRQGEYHLWLGRAYGRAALAAGMLRQAGLAKDAQAALEKAVSVDPNLLDARADLIQFYLMAPSFMGGSVDKAREQAAAIAQRDAVRGAIARATIAIDQEDLPGAVKELEAAVQRSNGDSRARMTLGSILQQQEKWDAAFAQYDAILAREPDHWDALYQVGRAAALSGRRLDRGEAALRRYVAHPQGPESPPIANAHYRLGMVLEKKGDKAAARTAYQAALRLDPKLDDAKAALAKLG
jgi:tetratricopeptide (TPR) repeat protein